MPAMYRVMYDRRPILPRITHAFLVSARWHALRIQEGGNGSDRLNRMRKRIFIASYSVGTQH